MIEFDVPGMSCSHCIKVVTEAVKSVDPSAKVAVDLPTHKVRVETAREADDVAAALRQAGYEPG